MHPLLGFTKSQVSMSRIPPDEEFYLLGRIPKAAAG